MSTALLPGIPERPAHKLLDLLTAQPQLEAIWLFGSRAMGRYQPGSDIDLCLDAPLTLSPHINAPAARPPRCARPPFLAIRLAEPARQGRSPSPELRVPPAPLGPSVAPGAPAGGCCHRSDPHTPGSGRDGHRGSGRGNPPQSRRRCAGSPPPHPAAATPAAPPFPAHAPGCDGPPAHIAVAGPDRSEPPCGAASSGAAANPPPRRRSGSGRRSPDAELARPSALY
ncbi:nucleotidyltransferase domain-containing protein [Cyanobium sp. HWJ4-Hawea]|nr:nucleotidyltransferase domain-containing protein [Cyanobium sp. HWJ4-Hawea]